MKNIKRQVVFIIACTMFLLSFMVTFAQGLDLSEKAADSTTVDEKIDNNNEKEEVMEEVTYITEDNIPICHWDDIAYNGEDLYVTIGETGKAGQEIIGVSINGTKWESEYPDLGLSASGYFNYITYYNNQFMIWGFYGYENGSVGILLSSTDGINWSREDLSTKHHVVKKIIKYNDLFFAINNYGEILKSDNMKDWVIVCKATQEGLRDILRNDKLVKGSLNDLVVNGKRLLGVGSNDKGAFTLISDDGVNWSENQVGLDSIDKVTSGEGKFIAISGNTLLSSVDGEKWTEIKLDVEIDVINDIEYNKGVFLAVGSKIILRSEDGEKWEQIDNVNEEYDECIKVIDNKFYVGGSFRSVIKVTEDGEEWDYLCHDYSSIHKSTYSENHNKYLTYISLIKPEYKGKSKTIIAMSKDNKKWIETYKINSDKKYKYIAIQNVKAINNQYFAYGYTDLDFHTCKSSGILITSSDGYTWNDVEGEYGYIVDVIYCNGKYFALGWQNSILSSVDGQNWVVENYRDVSYGIVEDIIFDGKQYIAAGSGIFTSSDNCEWNKLDIKINNWLQHIEYGNNVYVRINYQDSVAVSNDLVNWEYLHFYVPTFDTKDLEFIDGKFIITTEGDTSYTSTDGRSWKEN